MTWEYYNIETTNLCLNIIFISIFTILVKSVLHEISLKMHQKAAKILLVPPDPLHLHQHRVLVTSLVQVLVVWVLVTLLQLAGLRPYPGQDLLLASLGLAAAKLALVTTTRDTRLLDLGVAAHILGLAALLSIQPHGSVLELGSEALVIILVAIPILCAGMLLAPALLLVVLQVKTILSVISLALLLGAFKANRKFGAFIFTLAFFTFIRQQIIVSTMPHTKSTFQNDTSIEDTPKEPLSLHLEEENSKLAEGFINSLQQAEYSLPIQSTTNVLVRRSYIVVRSVSDNHRECLVEGVDTTDRGPLVTTVLGLLSSFSLITSLLLPTTARLRGPASAPACHSLRGREVSASVLVTCATNQSCWHPASWGHWGWGGSVLTNVVAMLSRFKTALTDGIF